MDESIVPVNQIAVRPSTCYEFSNSNPAEVVEIEDDDTSVGTVERQLEDLKLNYQFNEKDVPEIFQTLINDRIDGLRNVFLDSKYSSCVLGFDDLHIRFENNSDNWTVTYEQINTTIETVDPEKSIIDHLWFVLKNPNIKLEKFNLACDNSEEDNRQKLNTEKLISLLQSVLNSFNHQIQIKMLAIEGFNEDTFLLMLQNVKPGALEFIGPDISWEEKGNYQKMKEIVKTDQWKQAKRIYSRGITPLKIDDFFRYENFWLELDKITPDVVLQATEHLFNSIVTNGCFLSCRTENYDIDAIIDFLGSQIDGSTITKTILNEHEYEFYYKIVKSGNRVLLVCKDDYISIGNPK